MMWTLLLSSLAFGQNVCETHSLTPITCQGVGFQATLNKSEPKRLNGYIAPVTGQVLQSQAGAEHIYTFTCPHTGLAFAQIKDLDCDLDLFVMEATCDPSADVADYNTSTVVSGSHFVEWFCVESEVYYLVVEGYALDANPGSCPPGGLFGFLNAYSDYRIFAYCEEICDDGEDNDGDLDVDCGDDDCECVELDCNDGADEDLDGLIDCADPDCVCVETDCDDGLDDDGDGATDCL
ncbi:MAG: hypothetical protein ACON5B_08060, partial [Myxococcota bacterium]